MQETGWPWIALLTARQVMPVQKGAEKMSQVWIPSTLLTYLVVTGLVKSAATAKAKRRGDVISFGPLATIRTLLGVATVGFATASIYACFGSPRSSVAASIFALISVSGALGVPSEIMVSEEGIKQIKWWGATLFMAWPIVTTIEVHKGSSTTIVRDSMNRKIVHSGFNRDPQSFREICQQRTHLPSQIHEI
jgi:hypothetical protein